jgi:hypothetical protein
MPGVYIVLSCYNYLTPAVSFFFSWTTYCSSFFFFFFGGTGVWTKGFAIAKQVLYSLSHTSSLLCSGYFWRWVSFELFSLPALNCDPSNLSLPGVDYRCEPLAPGFWSYFNRWHFWQETLVYLDVSCFFGGGGTGFELRTSHLQSRHSTNWPKPPGLLCRVNFPITLQLLCLT